MSKPTKVFHSPLPDITIPEINAAEFVLYSPKIEQKLNQAAITDALTGKAITFGQLRDDSEALARGLVNTVGVGKGEVIAVYAGNHLVYSTVVYGILLAGATVSTINAAYMVDELLYQLKDSAATMLVTDKDGLERAFAAADKAGIARSRIYVLESEAIEGAAPISDLFERGVPGFKRELTKEELCNMPAFLTYSSGTTGRSKGVQTTHRNMVANAIQIAVFVTDSSVDNGSWLTFLPLFHIYGLNMSLFVAPSSGVPIALMSKFEFVFFLKAIQTYKPATVLIVPPVALLLARHPLVDKFDMTSLNQAISGAAMLSKEVCLAIKQRLGITVAQGYGLTETSPMISVCSPKDPNFGSIGVLACNMEARLVDPVTKEDAAEGQPGELWVRGPNVMKGYHNNAEATADSIDADGYFHTGDVATIAPTGHLYIVDRLKELIKYSGLQVPPAELEAVLLGHPKIADAAVIGCADEVAGELPVAYVVLRAGQTATMEEVQAFVAERVAAHKRLRGGVFFADAIPRSAAGKILRRVLRERDAQRIQQEEEEASTNAAAAEKPEKPEKTTVEAQA